MEDSQQEKGKQKCYEVWSLEESNELLKLMVDAANRGWRDNNGLLSKIIVEKNILPVLNEKLGCQKTYPQYLNRLKWFKQRYNNYFEIMRHSSGFGWDPITKKFIANEEVWKDYFKSHPTHRHYCTDTFADYEDLRIAIGNETTIGKHSIGLENDIDVRTFGVEDNRGASLDDFIYDHTTKAFIQSDEQYQPLSPEHIYSPLVSQSSNSEVPPTTRKRIRMEFEGKSSSLETNHTHSDAIDKLTYSIDKIAQIIESFATKELSCWKLIKEIPNLDNHTRFKALDLLNTRAKKIEFLEMTPEDRVDWIAFQLMQ